MGLFAQPPLGANTVAIAHDQHADHQLRVNRRTSNWAVKIGEVMAQVAQIETPINAAQKVIGGDVIFKVERVKTVVPAPSITVPSAACFPAGKCENFAAGQTGELLFQQNRPKAVSH